MRIKVYLDTSVIGYLRADDLPERMKDTLDFWEILKTGKFEVYISDVVITELSRCYEPKRSELFTHLAEIDYNKIDIENNDEIDAISEEIRKLHILPSKSNDDRRHIAAAIYNRCNIIISWNFRHMVNPKTRNGVKNVCLSNNIGAVDICKPADILPRRKYNV